MYIIYSPKLGKQVVRRISVGETVAALIRTKDGNIGCWSCGARVCPLSPNSMICVECGSRMEIGKGQLVKLSMTSEGAILSKPTLVGGIPQNIGIMETGDAAVFPEPGNPDFNVNDHDPIGCTTLELFLEAASYRSIRART